MEGLKKKRAEKQLSQRELGKALGLSAITIYQYESDRRFPNKAVLLRMADFFGCTVNDLL